MPDPIRFKELAPNFGTALRIIAQEPGKRRFLTYRIDRLRMGSSGCSYTPRGVGSGEVVLGINTTDQFMKNEFQMWFTIKQWLGANTCYYCQQLSPEWRADAEEEDLIHVEPVDWHVRKDLTEFLRLTNWEYMDAELCGYWIAHNHIADLRDIKTFFEEYPQYSMEATEKAAKYTRRRYIKKERITGSRTEKFNELLEAELEAQEKIGYNTAHVFMP